MSVPEVDETDRTPLVMQTSLLVGALVVILGLMYYSYIYPYPDGKPPDFWGFVLFWLREILIVTLAVLLMLVLLGGWCVRLVKSLFSRT